MNEKQAKEMLKLLSSVDAQLKVLVKQTDPKRQGSPSRGLPEAPVRFLGASR